MSARKDDRLIADLWDDATPIPNTETKGGSLPSSWVQSVQMAHAIGHAVVIGYAEDSKTYDLRAVRVEDLT